MIGISVLLQLIVNCVLTAQYNLTQFYPMTEACDEILTPN